MGSEYAKSFRSTSFAKRLSALGFRSGAESAELGTGTLGSANSGPFDRRVPVPRSRYAIRDLSNLAMNCLAHRTRPLYISMLRLKAPTVLLLLLAFVAAYADQGSVRLSAFPTMAVADARSTVTVTAEVRENSGRPAPNGTQVIFQTTLGHFQQSPVSTVDGFARAVFVAGGSAGTAKITASAISLGATATTELELVTDRRELNSSNAYIQFEAPIVLRYDVDSQILAASGASHAVTIQVGKATIQTDDMQFNVATQELRARRAKVSIKGHTYDFTVLDLFAMSHRAVGTTSYTAQGVSVISVGNVALPVARTVRRFGPMQLKPSGELEPMAADTPAPNFTFATVQDGDSMVLAKRAVVFPGREIQFQRAQINMGGMHLMSLPLYSLNLTTGAGSLGDQVLTMNNNKVGINYPYYLGLNPGFSSLLRFTTGQPYGRSFTGNSATLLNYEMTWNKADGTEGGLTMTGINRPDWSLDAHHSLHFEDGSSLSALVSSPERRSVFSSVAYNKPLKGFQFSLNANGNRTLIGPQSDSRAVSAVLESDPHKVHAMPLTLFYGLTSSDSQTSFIGQSQHVSTTGLRLRGQFDPFRLDKVTNLNANFSLNQQYGRLEGLAIYGSLGMTRQMPWGSMGLNYDYAGDNTLASVASGGKQRLSLDTNYGLGKANLHFFASRSLDADWSSFYGDCSYQLSGLYTLSAGYTLDKYLSNQSLDYDLLLSYRVGIREIGLVWSKQTNRIGLEVLGARF
jgi:hypothetical protein